MRTRLGSEPTIRNLSIARGRERGSKGWATCPTRSRLTTRWNPSRPVIVSQVFCAKRLAQTVFGLLVIWVSRECLCIGSDSVVGFVIRQILIAFSGEITCDRVNRADGDKIVIIWVEVFEV